MRKLCVAALSMLLLDVLPSNAGETGWRTFNSNSGFSISYPTNWPHVARSRDALDIMSSSRRITAVVISKGESEIVVREIALPRNQTWSDFTRKAYEFEPEHRQTIHRQQDSAQDSCGDVERGDVQFDVAPGVFQLFTFFICRIGDRAFELRLIRWRDDGPSEQHERIALTMLGSLRVAKR